MKKLGLKLGLSCAALAACATTLVSTTFAWYTSNDTVSATGLTASTDSAASDALQISLNGETWGTTVSLAGITEDLMPVARTANNNAVGTYNLQGGTDNAPGTGNEATSESGIVQFNLYFRNVAQASSVYLKSAVIANQNAGGVDAKLVADLADNYTTAQNSKYKVDIMRALDCEIVVATGDVADENTAVVNENIASYTGQSATAYDFEDYLDSSAKDTIANNNLSGWDALEYYNAVKGTEVTRADGVEDVDNSFKTEAIGSKLADTDVTTIVKTTWTIYLDGWDTACYDACKSQSVTFDFTFNTVG